MTRSAKFGAKLNYIRQLNGTCPEGYQLQYFKEGGNLCKRCMKVHQEGGEVVEPMSVTEQFRIESAKCGKKMKKAACGNKMPKAACGNKVEKQACGGKSKKVKKHEGGGIAGSLGQAALAGLSGAGLGMAGADAARRFGEAAELRRLGQQAGRMTQTPTPFDPQRASEEVNSFRASQSGLLGGQLPAGKKYGAFGRRPLYNAGQLPGVVVTPNGVYPE